MSNKKIPKDYIPNIGLNTRWDTPSIDPTAGSTIRKPPTSLKPKDNGPKK